MSSPRIATTMAPNPCTFSPTLFTTLNPASMFVNFKRVPTNLTIPRVSNCLNFRPQELRNLSPSPVPRSGVVSLRLRRLVSEFRSLPEPIDRVKRLLDYASVLTQLTESTRCAENRVAGCAAQVWLEAEMDDLGRMRFGADSDSEITKGFCSCLIYLLYGAFPEEVLAVKAEDLSDMNVGLPVRSRVNSWHNVLVSMQERTKSVVVKRKGSHLVEPLSSLVLSPEGVIAKEKVLFS